MSTASRRARQLLRFGRLHQTGYEFDKVGNRTKKTETTAAGTETTVYSYDSNDRLQQETRTSGSAAPVTTLYAWDNNGNLKSKTEPNQLTLYYWDSDNRLIEVKQGASPQDPH